MAYQLIDQELSSNLVGIDRTENLFPEHGRGKVVICLSNSLSQSHIRAIEDGLFTQGVYLTAPIVQVGRALHIRFEKRIGPLLIIGLVVGAIAAAATAFFGWQIFEEVKKIPWWGLAIGGFTALGIVYYLVRGIK